MGREEPAADDLGVVEPLRAPDWLERERRRFAAWFGAQPLLVRLFVGLSALDVVARGLGIVGPPLLLDPTQLINLLASFLPHNLLILLPALVVARRRTAPADTPNVVDGAIFVALAELLVYPSTALASTIGGIGLWAIVAVAVVAVQVVGWVTIGRDLSTLNLTDPHPITAGWANLAAFAIVATVAMTLVGYLAGPGIDVGDAELNRLMTLNNLAHILAPLALAYVGRAVIRGLDDERRPEVALRLGAGGVFLAAGLGLAVALVDTLAAGRIGFAESIVLGHAWGAMHWLASGGGISLLVVAFWLGLADDGQRAAEEVVTLEPR